MAIASGYLLVAVGAICLGFLVISGMDRLHTISGNLYNYPFKASLVISRADSVSHSIRNAMLSMGLATHLDEIEPLMVETRNLDFGIRGASS